MVRAPSSDYLRNPAWLLLLLFAASCRRDMQDQPKYKDLRGSAFFADGRSARPLPEDTVARGFLNADRRFATGKVDGQPIAELPIPLTKELLARGRERYGIYCSPCHGLTGDGLGIVVQRGLRRPNSFQIDRLRAAPVGYFFDVQTVGFGAMLDYSAQIPPKDRWAIAAYIRALQLSQGATISDVPADARPALESPQAAPRAAPLVPNEEDWREHPIVPTAVPGEHAR
ncbi:MAG TPA: cytochrome c [Thermoanaerobaculia bacterium]|nr:cytochrome c [Thermoanaerobaculia bacterium]